MNPIPISPKPLHKYHFDTEPGSIYAYDDDEGSWNMVPFSVPNSFSIDLIQESLIKHLWI